MTYDQRVITGLVVTVVLFVSLGALAYTCEDRGSIEMGRFPFDSRVVSIR